MKAEIIHLNKYLKDFNQAVNLKNKIRKMKSCQYRKTHGKYHNVKCWSHFTRLLKMNGNTVFSLNIHIHILPIVYSVLNMSLLSIACDNCGFN